ncbi:MAG TPA: DUF4337 domain-containing protein [Bryobacteraceae bacterium]|nr:DUF4337 domain-containing protein [Bryobacteraceae bacterium]
MAELEIHHESHHPIDPAGQRVGVLAAVLAVILAVVGIISHRAHTNAIILTTHSSDIWAEYQSTRLKFHNVELGEAVANLVGGKNGAAQVLADYERQKRKYESESAKLMDDAHHSEAAAEELEHRALRFDIGDGLLEVALVVTSLYFISHKKMFPVIGVVAGIAGVVIAAAGFLA